MIPSPCIGICEIDENTSYCIGCFRTLNEIKVWRVLPDRNKLIILEKVKERFTFG